MTIQPNMDNRSHFTFFFWWVQNLLNRFIFGGSKVFVVFWWITASSLVASVLSLGGIMLVGVADREET